MINANLDAESNLPNKNSRGEVNEQMNIINLYKDRHTITDCWIFCPEKSNLNKFDFRYNWQQKFGAIPGKIRRKKWFGCSLARSFLSSWIYFQMPIEEKQKDCWKSLRTMLRKTERNQKRLVSIQLPPWWNGSLPTWLSWRFLIGCGAREPQQILLSTAHLPTRHVKTFWDLSPPDIARQKPRPVTDLSESTAP